MHTIAAKAVALKEAMSEEFRLYQARVLSNARKLAETLFKKGYKIVSGGTDCHMFLVDLTPLKISGLEAQNMLESAGITVNKNSIPYDKKSPTETSGIRIGTPAITTRGMKESEMVIIGDLIDKVLKSRGEKRVITYVKTKVKALLDKFPLYPELKY
jgi:glycine hydroxymethyltransferase